MKRAVIVHCWEGTPDYCWYPWVKNELEKKGWIVQVPAMPHTEEPTEEDWVPFLAGTVGEPADDLILVGHSVGCITILRYLESLPPGRRVGGVVMVAGFTDDLGFDELNNYFTRPVDFSAIRGKAGRFVDIYSDNDPFVPVRHADILKDNLGAELVLKPGLKHFSGPVDKEESCVELPDVVEAVDRMAR